MEKDARAVLETFNGLPEAPPNVETRENYWVLIGKTGKIVDDNQSGFGKSQPVEEQPLDQSDRP